MKHIPQIGEHLYIRKSTGNEWIDMIKHPYTVIKIINDNNIIIQEAECIFPTPRYYDTLPTEIVEDKFGTCMKMKWSEKKQKWLESPQDNYPYFAVFGKWDYQPYLN